MFWNDKKGIDQELYSAVINGDVDKVRKLVRDKDILDLVDDKGMSVVHYAIKCDEMEILDILIANGADVNLKDKDGIAPLHLASGLKNVDAVRMLIDANAGVNDTDNWDFTPLHSAVLNCKDGKHDNTASKEIVKILVENGADSDAINIMGHTPLIDAVCAGNYSAIQGFIEAGVYLETKDNDGRTALVYAISRGDEKAIEMLIDAGCDVMVKDDEGKVALRYAKDEKTIQMVMKAYKKKKHKDEMNFDFDMEM